MRRLLSALLIAVGLSTLAGCGPTESIDGPTATYKHKPGGALLLLVAGLGVTAAGGYFVYQDYQIAQDRKRRRKKGRARAEDTSYTNTGRKWGLLITGVLMLFVFLPGMLLARITVTADEVVVDDSLWWFLPNSTTVRFDELRDIDSRSEEKWSRRGGKRTDEYVVFHKIDGSTEEVKATALVKAAMGRVMAGLEARRNQAPADEIPPAGNQPVAVADSTTANDLSSTFGGLFPGAGGKPAPSGSSNRSDVTTTTVPPAGTGPIGGTRTPQATPATNPANTARTNTARTNTARTNGAGIEPGFAIPADASVPSGITVLARIDGRWTHATALKTQPDGTIQVVPFSKPGQADSLPRAEVRSVVPDVIRSPKSVHAAKAVIATAAPVTAATKLQKGMRLKGLDGLTWRDAEVLDVLPNGQVKVHWVGWDATWDEALPREKLRLAPGTPAATDSEKQPTSQPSGAISGGSQPKPPGRPIGTQPLRRGTRVMVQMDDQWRPGTVIADAAGDEAKVLILGVPGVPGGPQPIPLNRLRLR